MTKDSIQNIRIRKPINSDYNEVNKLLGELHNKHVEAEPMFYKHSSSFMEEEFLEMIDKDDTIILIAELTEQQQVVGFLSGQVKKTEDKKHEVDRKRLWIDSIVVDKNFKKMGIASSLMNHLESELKCNNIDEMRLMVWTFNDEARGFFESRDMITKAFIMKKDL